MTPLTDELEALREEFRTDMWTPSAGEITAAACIAALPELTAITIRNALQPARLTRSRLVIAYEKVASVMSLPAIHEEPDSRDHLLYTARDVAREIAAA
ncbi:hypothetical protein [Kitasatospora sp. NPDC056181]|uniref:hypothetical protein n=1 Tax=Kitasatospora sp. NPDC056181 TaxID=3345737 RepID=UPI0035DA9788